MAWRVEHHLDDRLDVSVRRLESADVHAEAARDGRGHRFSVQALALDLARLDQVGGCLNNGLPLEAESQSFQVAYQSPACGEPRPKGR
jgi:hypothetical protein